MEVKICKADPAVKTPSKKNKGDAGYDLHYWSPEGKTVEIQPGESALLDTGLKFYFPSDYVMEIKNRSGIAAKRGLLVGACCVDSSFGGYVFINCWNVSNKVQTIEPGERCAQAIFYKVENLVIDSVSAEDYAALTANSTRQDGALGSTGKF